MSISHSTYLCFTASFQSHVVEQGSGGVWYDYGENLSGTVLKSISRIGRRSDISRAVHVGWRLSPACCHCDTTPAKMHETDSLDRRTGRTPQWTIALANTQTNIARPNARLSTRHITYSRIRYHTNLNKTYTQILYTQQHYEYDGWHEEITQSAGRVGMTAGVVLPSPLTQLSGNGQCEVAFWLSIFVVLFFRGFPPNYHTRR